MACNLRPFEKIFERQGLGEINAFPCHFDNIRQISCQELRADGRIELHSNPMTKLKTMRLAYTAKWQLSFLVPLFLNPIMFAKDFFDRITGLTGLKKAVASQMPHTGGIKLFKKTSFLHSINSSCYQLRWTSLLSPYLSPLVKKTAK